MDNFTWLAQLLHANGKRMIKENTPLGAELGTILAGGLLKTDSGFRIPREGYLLSQTLTGQNTATAQNHLHTVPALRPPSPGDRVLVVWVRNTPVVLAVITG